MNEQKAPGTLEEWAAVLQRELEESKAARARLQGMYDILKFNNNTQKQTIFDAVLQIGVFEVQLAQAQKALEALAPNVHKLYYRATIIDFPPPDSSGNCHGLCKLIAEARVALAEKGNKE